MRNVSHKLASAFVKLESAGDVVDYDNASDSGLFSLGILERCAAYVIHTVAAYPVAEHKAVLRALGFRIGRGQLKHSALVGQRNVKQLKAFFYCQLSDGRAEQCSSAVV